MDRCIAVMIVMRMMGVIIKEILLIIAVMMIMVSMTMMNVRFR